MNYARNWKWMVPGTAFGLWLVLMRFMLISELDFVRWFAVLPGFAALTCAIAAVGGLIDYRRSMSTEILERRMNALARSQYSAELEAARGVHPDAVKLIYAERHRVWMLKSGVQADGSAPHSVLYGAPSVTDFFLKYFLDGSTEKSVMPKRALVDGRKNRFDPWGAVSEYEMYDRLIELLRQQGKLVKWGGDFSPYEWAQPWTPEMVAEDFGIELDVVDEVEAMEVA